MFPALAGRFLTTAPPGKPSLLYFCYCLETVAFREGKCVGSIIQRPRVYVKNPDFQFWFKCESVIGLGQESLFLSGFQFLYALKVVIRLDGFPGDITPTFLSLSLLASITDQSSLQSAHSNLIGCILTQKQKMVFCFLKLALHTSVLIHFKAMFIFLFPCWGWVLL